MQTCPDAACRTRLTDADLAMGLCQACGKVLPAKSEDLLARHRKNLNEAAGHGKIVETLDPEEPR